jgi:hypothetical protein
MKEVNFLRKKDAGGGKIDFVDFTAPDYSPEQNAGLDYMTAMGEMHAILPDGSVVTKVSSGPSPTEWNRWQSSQAD